MSLVDLRSESLDVHALLARLLDLDAGLVSRSGVLTAGAFVAWEDGHACDALTLIRQAALCSDRGPHGAPTALPRLALATMLSAVGRLREAGRYVGTAGRDLWASTDDRSAVLVAIFGSRVHLAAGRLREAVADAETGIARAHEPGARRFVSLAYLTLAGAALARDDLRAATAEIARYRAEPPGPRANVGWATFAWTEARACDALEGPGRALEVLGPVYDDLDTHQRLLLEEPASAGGLVRLALAAHDATKATAVADRAVRLAHDNEPEASVAASAAHARGLLERDAQLLEHAACGHRQPWARASAAEDAGVVLEERGDHDRARVQLERAQCEDQRAAADRDLARIRARLRDVGVHHRHGHGVRRPVEGWASLTETERRVTGLVAEGLTNQQVGARMFVSRHTVDSHLRQIFRKLTITSRVELTRIALERRSQPRTRVMWETEPGATLVTSTRHP
jgi:DNA-binding CsgD family transcriptional regulator/tetratricopeptide (TPR) repeat protein